ncbi:hypothetical protein [Nocardiopsis dassonvillei]|uniref:Uncharacterized protein n=1 Tax=Nocardiopsis dassonvillei (strain ATCC 23218 / DSM 43111 / CIP 107115 / JCM 7437 / KCTC 9190 / NBRC 14626 / NCTC 10488 / NRRL B-5397 / IMRU 509) TaxID=446468 RepID=D7B8B6_NOCDD|nr:hypothetical protein [Nocardiopsis dassonvillei]ADH70424.1 conserved hypothetical protein [Nocardiopsis dassonvillei subsp. dassonvillei DSM 43111]NKY77054.1 hypothetical protein [Nocardiopsis dassonvillei]VEI91333.1 Uncharacterised protein [Nocardiopsis dassonvillei]
MLGPYTRKGGLSPEEQQEILVQIGSRILSEAPEGWKSLTYRVQTVIEHASSELIVEFGDGTSRRKFPPADISLIRDKLRAGMYQEGKGTWFSFEYVITPPGRFNVTYNYDEDPGITFPTAFGFTNDLVYFPRDEEYMTDWLREKLREEAEGRAME